jgi:hypothetical protein
MIFLCLLVFTHIFAAAQCSNRPSVSTLASSIAAKTGANTGVRTSIANICNMPIATISDADLLAFLNVVNALSITQLNNFFVAFGTNNASLEEMVKERTIIDMWKESPNITDIVVLKAYRTIPTVMNHVQLRDLSNLTKREVIGCHDADQWNSEVRKVNFTTTYTVPSGLLPTDTRVPEVVILREVMLATPGVTFIEYRVPALDRGRTTGALKGGTPFSKTIYDPAVWTDVKLKKAIKEAFYNAIRTGSLGTPSSSGSRKFSGTTMEGYRIEGFFAPSTSSITTFYFI